MLVNHVLLGIFWVIYCVLHSVLASLHVKEKIAALFSKAFRYYRIFYTVFAFAGLALILLMMFRMESPLLFQLTMFFIIAGILLSFSGLVLMLICIRKYFFSLSGLKSLFYEGHSHQLIITGVHRYVRHPLYLGTFAFIWGLFLLMPYASVLITNIVITIYTLFGIHLEEQKLLKEFGSDYAHYRLQVPRLLPSFKKRFKNQTTAGNARFTD